MADNTAAIQALFDAVPAPGVVVLPAGVSEIGTINYRGQSVQGVSEGGSVLLGKPGQDVLHVDPALAYTAAEGQRLSDFTIRVDDSVDASASFPDRAGVGNACFAEDFANGSAAPPLMMNRASLENVKFESLSGSPDGQSKSCGVYTQFQAFNLARWRNVSFYRLAYGLWDDYPRVNLTSTEHARDHGHYDSLYFNFCGRSWRMVNHANTKVTNLAIHGGGHGLEMVAAVSAVRQSCSLVSFDTVMIEAVATALDLSGATRCLWRDIYISGNTEPLTIASDGHRFSDLTSWGTPALRLTGSYNTIDALYAAGGIPMPSGAVEDLGVGNRVRAWMLPLLSPLITEGNRAVYLSEQDEETPNQAGQEFLDKMAEFAANPPNTGLMGL